MHNLTKIDEFKAEAGNALFNKQQALSIAKRLLEMEAADNANHSADDCRLLSAAALKLDFSYLDQNKTQTDVLLDSYGVARITSEDITTAIDNILFDVK